MDVRVRADPIGSDRDRKIGKHGCHNLQRIVNFIGFWTAVIHDGKEYTACGATGNSNEATKFKVVRSTNIIFLTFVALSF